MSFKREVEGYFGGRGIVEHQSKVGHIQRDNATQEMAHIVVIVLARIRMVHYTSRVTAVTCVIVEAVGIIQLLIADPII